jgi:hypothetical protein
MQTPALSIDDYIEKVSEVYQPAIKKLRDLLVENMPDGFSETMNYGMPSVVIPHSIYPSGYHCDPKLPLPFVSIAAQKNFIAFYHMGIYANPQLLDWFVSEYPKYSKAKLDMGKSCIRFKKPEQIPFELLAELMRKMTAQEWIQLYEQNLKK